MLGQAKALGALALLSAISAFHVSLAQPGYVLTLPRVLRAGSDEKFCITLHDVDDPVFSFTLRLEHKETQEQHDSEYEITDSFSQCMQFTVPTETGKYFVILRNDTTDIGASGPTEVEVQSKNLITLVQTDKPIYKPGQKVQFRVLTLTRDLMTRNGTIQSIFIKNPNDIRVKQWLNIQTEGMTSYNFPMPAEPKLGEWKVEVTVEGETTSHTFKVEEYVLPKFDVKVTPPPFLLANASTIDGKICAEYTYGKPVVGYVSLEICLTTYRYTGRPCYIETREINGCYMFSINSSEIEMNNMKYYLYGSKLEIKASVRERSTGAVVNQTTDEPKLTYEPLKITLEDDTNGFFKPIFPYHGRARVTTPDGKPAPGELLTVTLVDYRNDIRLESNYTTDKEGIVYFTVCDIITEKTEDFSIEARGILYSEPDSYNGLSNALLMPRYSKTVKQWYSPSNSYISIQRHSRTVPCGQELEVTIPYSTTLNSYTKFYYQVMSRGRIMHTGHKLHHFLKHDSTEFLEVPMESCLQEVPTPSPPPEAEESEEGQDPEGGEGENPPIEEMFVEEPIQGSMYMYQPGAGLRRRKRSSASEPELPGKEIVDGTQGQGGEEAEEEPPASPPPPPTPSRHVSHFTIRVPVTDDMSPSASLLIYYVRDDGETVADSIIFNVEACFKNKVKLDFAEKKVVPGGEATLRLQADPGSLCSIGVVDKSINILGGDHQLTPEKMFDILKGYGLGSNKQQEYYSDKEYCERSVVKDEDDGMYHGWWLYSSRYVDAIEAFRQMGMAVSTNLVLETRPCTKEYAVYYDSGMPMLAMGLSHHGSAETSKKEKPVLVRTFFPETWLWEMERVRESGKLELRKTTPHTITKWVGNTICTSQSKGLGVSSMTSLTTFQPFFLSMNLPYAAVRGERLPIHVTIFNYLEKCLYMQVNLEVGEGLSVVIRDHLKLPFCLCGGRSKTQSYYITPDDIGKLPVIAKAEIVPGTCDNSIDPDREYLGLKDSVKRELFVKAEGVTQEYTKSLYICPKDFSALQEVIDLPLPASIVMDSARGHVSVMGDIMGPALSNLDNLVHLPTGCGEQTMINFAPNIYVLKYLTLTLQLTDDMKLLTERYMEIGYNRELTFSHADGSFSAFGKSDTSGSTWLTAFVIKSFAQALRFIYIDQSVIDNGIKFLKSTRLENGCFREVGKVFSSYLMGGLGKVDNEDDTALTAFVVVALLEARTPSSDRMLKSALRCLVLQPVDEMDTYTLSLLAYALALNDSSSQDTSNVMEELNKRVISDGVLSYWGRDGSKPAAVNTWHYQTAPSAEIEMTSYALMATLLYYKEDAIARAQPIVLWLSQQRNAFGGFSSTQDTVLGLQALSEFASKTFSGNVTDLTINFNGNMMNPTYNVISGVNTLLLQKSSIKHLPNTVTVSANGTGCALVQANVQYNVLPKNLGIDEHLFNLTVAVRRSRSRRSDCARRSMRICVRFKGKKDYSAGMSLLTVKMVTAWTPVVNSLIELKSLFPILSMKKYENDVEKGLIAFYFDELDIRKRCFEFDVQQDRELAVSDPKPAELQAYQYYERDVTVVTSYNIKTTCGTKEEIPEEETEAGWAPWVPIPWQVRFRDMDPPPLPTQKTPDAGCPVCLNEEPDDFNELICQSKTIFKAQAGRNGKAPMKIKADLRPRKKVRIDKFASFSLGTQCQCDLLNPPNSKKRVRRLLILSRSDRSFVQKEGSESEEVGHVINLDNKSIIINLDINRGLERETKKKARRCKRRLL